jgi:hypothetical protein
MNFFNSINLPQGPSTTPGSSTNSSSQGVSANPGAPGASGSTTGKVENTIKDVLTSSSNTAVSAPASSSINSDTVVTVRRATIQAPFSRDNETVFDQRGIAENVKGIGNNHKIVGFCIMKFAKKIIEGVMDIPDYLASKVAEKQMNKEIKKIVIGMNGDNLKKLFENCKDNDTTIKLVHKLLSSAEQIMRDEGGRDPYLFVLNTLREKFPKIDDYFYDLGPMETPILSPKGVEVIINNLKTKGSLNKVDCHVCADHEAFKEQVQKTILDFEAAAKQLPEGQSPTAMSCTFVVRQQKPPFKVKEYGETQHNTPILLQRDANGVWTAIITDSKGDDMPDFPSMINTSLETVFKSADQSVKMYNFSGPDRQYDKSNCPIFSIRDVVQFSQHSEEIIKWAEESVNGSRVKTYENSKAFATVVSFNRLPPCMMKTTQSFTVIQSYENKLKKDGKAPGQHLSKSLKHHTIVQLNPQGKPILDKDGKPKGKNFKIGGLLIKYQKMIYTNLITHVLENS